MRRDLKISIGQCSDKGRKETNQDFHGALMPGQPALTLKGIAIGIADGISSSSVSRVAAETAVKSFLTDYYSTSDAWSVKTSASRVISATNAWLNARSRQGHHPHDPDQGYVTTFSVVVLKSATAHIFHVGDARIYRLSGNTLEQLSEDHRVKLPGSGSYLGRALGAAADVEIDYRAVAIARGEVLVLATDGVHEFLPARSMAEIIAKASDLDAAAREIVDQALARGSDDNLTVQIVRIDEMPMGEMDEAAQFASRLPPPPLPAPRAMIDGYRIDRQIHGSSRSHIYLATDTENGRRVAIKIPSIDLRSEQEQLRRFTMEEWIARRIDSAHVLKAYEPSRPRTALYVVTEHVEGQTLRQWMIDNPQPDIEMVRNIVEQIAKGVRAFHRKEMLHQDLRPENIMIDTAGTVKIIDFGSTRVAGVVEAQPASADGDILGTLQYTAPEYFAGGEATPQSDLFSLGVIAYEMLTGKLPYGAAVSRARTRAQIARLKYVPAREANPIVPAWVDAALARAVAGEPRRRYEALSEFLQDLRQPNPAFAARKRVPLIERDPLMFWRILTLGLAVSNLALLALFVLRK